MFIVKASPFARFELELLPCINDLVYCDLYLYLNAGRVSSES